MADLNHEARVEYTQEKTRVFNAFLKIIPQLPDTKILSASMTKGRIDVITHPSFGSWGEKITINVTEAKPSITRVELKSFPRNGHESMPSNADRGSRHNIENILDETSKFLKI